MSSPEDLEDRLARALTSAAGTFPPPSADLVRRSVARGRRLRLLRAVRVAAATAVCAAVTAGGALVATGAVGGRAGDGTTRQAGPAASGPSVGQSSAPRVSSVSGAEMVRTLKSLLPPGGTVSAASGTGSRTDGPDVRPTARLTYSTARGSSGITLDIARLDPGLPADQQGEGGCLPVEVRPYDTCRTEKLPGGALLSTTESFTYPNSDTGQKRWYVVLTTAAGAQLTVQEFGGGGEKESAGGADPVLSTARLASIVRSPAWDRAIAALPAPRTHASPGPSATRQRVTGTRMTEVLRSRLPHGGTVSDLHADDGLVQLVYDDGRGRNMVEVDAQYGMTALLAGHMGCAGVEGDCRATTLSDGTKVKKVRGPSEKGGPAVVWLVDVLYPDGRRVAAREVNSYAESAPVTRPRPALAMDELVAIARDQRYFTG
ncbi:hypothetical protein GCM10018980_53740 [Streptomyces capoamus]|uniref:Uncharacterized protein n=1 Tax=Streptomyces capoamus TaxID=68183 RepID=A0A919F059_9ACTN|nr:hypothetical protein [Streptomyces capoamus]GGW18060.1 hypothetical protein GCM10010501_42160 [Streptomyces libani subsp. rufus]GHG63295.1 hypothetical protein GCM10018980_53740 [Streptomyces capoamus]